MTRLTGYGRFLRLSVPGKFLLIFGILLMLSSASQVLSVATRGTRMLLLATAGMGIVTASVFILSALKSRPRMILPTLAVIVLLVASGVHHFRMGDQAIDLHSLRGTYVQRIASFNGTLYIWGGETHHGIDCSGLVRMALVEAMTQRALIEGDADLLKTSARFWWQDMTAHGMMEHQNGYTKTIGQAEELSDPKSLVMKDGYTLREGDLAIAGGGSHVLVYTGKGCWTEANPEDMRVVTHKAAGSERDYFNMPVIFLRWWLFDDGRKP